MSPSVQAACLWCGSPFVSYGRRVGVHDFWWCPRHGPDAIALIQTVVNTRWRYDAITLNVPADALDTGYRPWSLAHEQQLMLLCYWKGEEGYVDLTGLR